MVLPEIAVARHCLYLYRWSRSGCQWATHCASVTGEWEWWFW